jgi:rRNA maturation endonuclease Nob1
MSDIHFRLHCPNCGNGIEETDKFCPYCGENLDAPIGDTELETLAQVNLQNARELLENGRNPRKALDACDQAIAYAPESAGAHNLRGLILDGLGRTPEAILAYTEALRLNPEDTEARANLADATADHRSIPHKRQWKTIAIVAAIVVLVVCLFAGAGAAYSYARSYLMPKTTVVFEPDRSRVSTVSQADLQQTARILNQRWSSLGYPATSFQVSPGGYLIGEVPVGVASAVIDSTKATGVIEFVDFGSTYYETGKVVNTDFETQNEPQADGQQWHTLLTNADIKTVSVTRDQTGNYVIEFTLNDKGKKILADYTAQNIGNYLGIVLDKGVVSCPTVNGAITSGSGQISGVFTYESASMLASYMRYTPLPIPLK